VDELIANAGKVLPVYIESEMKKSYIDYAMSVIVQRALPDVRDGTEACAPPHPVCHGRSRHGFQ
jgi:hypothetical protein